jgi:hypothetical protein
VLASVPDLVTVLDSQTGSHLGTPECKFYYAARDQMSILYLLDAYGLRVTGEYNFSFALM